VNRKKIRSPLVLRNRLDKLPVIHLIIARINRALKQLIHLFLAHLLAQIRQDVLDLALADEARAVLVKHLEPADVLLDVEGLAEPAGPVEDLAEGFEIDCGALAMHGLGVDGMGMDVQSAPTPRSRSVISASVGFWPHARSKSPRAERSTRPFPRLSKSWNASR
jgi:hypothetical protein